MSITSHYIKVSTLFPLIFMYPYSSFLDEKLSVQQSPVPPPPVADLICTPDVTSGVHDTELTMYTWNEDYPTFPTISRKFPIPGPENIAV